MTSCDVIFGSMCGSMSRYQPVFQYQTVYTAQQTDLDYSCYVTSQ